MLFFLQMNGVTVGDPNGLGNTALHLAAAENRAGVVQLLLKYEAPVNSKNQDNWTPLVRILWWL